MGGCFSREHTVFSSMENEYSISQEDLKWENFYTLEMVNLKQQLKKQI